MLVSGVSPPTNVAAVQNGPTSVLVSWIPSREASGYRVHYDDDSEGHRGNDTVSGGFTSSHNLTDLVEEANYTISVVSTSNSKPESSPSVIQIALG